MADDRLGGRRAPREPRDTTGRVPYVWVEDDDTGHRYDVIQTAVRAGMTPVDGVDLNYSGRPRRTKYRVDKSGQDAAPRTAAQVDKSADTDDTTTTSGKATKR